MLHLKLQSLYKIQMIFKISLVNIIKVRIKKCQIIYITRQKKGRNSIFVRHCKLLSNNILYIPVTDMQFMINYSGLLIGSKPSGN